jgi:hypothetical protein
MPPRILSKGAFNRHRCHNKGLAGDAGIGDAGRCPEAERTQAEAEKIHHTRACSAAVRYRQF